MKLFFATIAISITLVSCKPTLYFGSYGQINQTQVVLSNSNFKVLGSFKGMASEKKMQISIKGNEGLINIAKSNLLASAKSAGIELTGSRTLVNVCVDIIQNKKRVTVTISAEIIEFTK
ncbi:MAG: hypothetical protein IPK88_17820 [Saprospiraceae bacterium]|nr:hypothetical protein [Candidatus Defluviibacterium haderslevense]